MYVAIIIIYWKNIRGTRDGDITWDKNEGEGIRYKFLFKNGLKHGWTFSFFPNGSLKNLWYYKNGKQNGWRFELHESGKIFLIKYMKNDRMHGFSGEWDTQGKIKNFGSVFDKQPSGVWFDWYNVTEGLKISYYE